jgi:hypothetical protein
MWSEPVSSKYPFDRSKRSFFEAPRGRGMTKAKGALVSYLIIAGETGACLPAGRSASRVSLKELASRAGISVRSAQRMSPMIGVWAIALGTHAKTDLGGTA